MSARLVLKATLFVVLATLGQLSAGCKSPSSNGSSVKDITSDAISAPVRSLSSNSKTIRLENSLHKKLLGFGFKDELNCFQIVDYVNTTGLSEQHLDIGPGPCPDSLLMETASATVLAQPSTVNFVLVMGKKQVGRLNLVENAQSWELEGLCADEVSSNVCSLHISKAGAIDELKPKN